MSDFILYLIKASFSLSLFYTVFWIFLRRETLFLTNRFFLLLSLSLSIILPLIPIYYNAGVSADLSIRDTADSLLLSGSMNSDRSQILQSISRIAGLVYLSGVLVFLLRILLQFISLAGLVIRNGITVSGNTRIVYNMRYTMPFSFMNLVFINPEYIKESEFSDIIAHENVHIREYHWFDLLFVELITILLWFNPFIWFYERSIKQNHEYLADEGVIAQGFNVGRYHSVLINQLMGMEVIGITNNLNYSLNAKRLKMMKRKKSSKKRALRILWALPVLFILVAAFSVPRYESEESAVLTNSFSGKVTAAVMDKNGDPIPGASVKIKGSKDGTVTDKEGLFTMEVNDSDILIISFSGYEDSVVEMKKVVEKQGQSAEYKFKVMMEARGELMSKASNTEMSKDEMIKELEITLKKLSMKRDELLKMKQKIAQAEKEGTADQKELDKKKASLKEEMNAVSQKIEQTSKKLESLKK